MDHQYNVLSLRQISVSRDRTASASWRMRCSITLHDATSNPVSANASLRSWSGTSGPDFLERFDPGFDQLFRCLHRAARLDGYEGTSDK